ncbi:2-C-methyl-D-erythritol 4-phosphate cytidylyltransferase [Clostridium sp.]|jgi:2-C-methyl-D-erythritol 4-phosphate cytidylyltransferase|uniref:2-C-methyl-D-erythritol 4-phosphate cytidylyltransferase n=1 Tax=Clostridium sp. TaxID=1506 RepID=UPI002582950E|nr:2-C-methyl-D-erythritol 4-phosphate cytidylyltransferase [Clostridium sp.]MDF2503725.1 2-C-methyl-D-erythritol 4-phosphate cytidylyltransferase [Clostridium sp.]
MGKNCAIVLAGGKGKRMGREINKLFIKLNDKPILAYTLEAFENNECIDTVILVAAKDEVEYCRSEIILKYSLKKIKKIVCGGNQRQESVINGLNAAKEFDIVLIHDGARPFVSDKIICDGIKYANIYGACACGVIPKDTIKIKNKKGFSENTLDRDKLFCVQTPQSFKLSLIIDAHKSILNKNISATDDTMVAEMCGYDVFLYEGSYINIKMTTPDDLLLGEKIIDAFNCLNS